MLRRYALFIVLLFVAAALIRSTLGDGPPVGDGIKAFFIPFATLYLDAFNSPSTAISLCVLMGAAGVALFFYYWIGRIAPVRRALQSIVSQLASVEAKGDPALLAKVDRIMEREPLLSRPWALYRSTLQRRADGRTSSGVQPGRYFNMQTLEGSGLRLRFFLGLPNDFVGLGLVFTFMGLVAGLYFASRSMMSTDLNVAREALVQLLHAATFKFLTSITGISLSLLLSWAQNVLLDGLRADLGEIQFLLEERFPLGSMDAPASLERALSGGDVARLA